VLSAIPSQWEALEHQNMKLVNKKSQQTQFAIQTLHHRKAVCNASMSKPVEGCTCSM
jgi:hypothetical protein